MGNPGWRQAVACGAWLLASGCADSGVDVDPWSTVTDTAVLQVSVAPDGVVAAVVADPLGRAAASVVSFDAHGAVQWTRPIGWGASVVALGDDRVVVAETARVVLHDRAGTTPFAIPATACGLDVHSDARGFVYVLVAPYPGGSIGGVPVDGWRGYIVTIDPQGALVGLEQVQGAGCPRVLAVSPGGRLLVRTDTGVFVLSGGVYRSVPEALRARLDSDAIVALGDDGSVAVATESYSPMGYADVRVTRLDRAGVEQWTHWVGGPGPDDLGGLALGPGGRVYVAATARPVAGTVVDPVVDLGELRAAIPATGAQAFFAAWEPDGRLAWGAAPGSADDDAATSLDLAPDGSLVVGGWFAGTMDLPDGTHMAAGAPGTHAGFVTHVAP